MHAQNPLENLQKNAESRKADSRKVDSGALDSDIDLQTARAQVSRGQTTDAQDSGRQATNAQTANAQTTQAQSLGAQDSQFSAFGNFMWHAFYRLLCAILWIIALPFLIASAFRQKHRLSIPARFFPFLMPLFARFLLPRSYRQNASQINQANSAESNHTKNTKQSAPDYRASFGGFCKDFAPDIWIHACSFGEVKSLEPIINALDSTSAQELQTTPHAESANHAAPPNILITTITQTGFELAHKTYAARAHIRVHFLPFEIFLPFYRRRFGALKTLIVTEAELWKELFWSTKRAGAFTMLINARISSRSYPKYTRFARFYRRLFDSIDLVLAQSAADKARLESIGAKRALDFGNLKLLSTPAVHTRYKKPKELLLIGASTHPSEEALILDAFLALKKSESCKLVLAPRHPERFGAVWKLLESYPLTRAKLSEINANNVNIDSAKNSAGNSANNPAPDSSADRAPLESAKNPASASDSAKTAPESTPKAPPEIPLPNVDVLLIDKLLELNNFYRISDIVILGGALVPVGGHNPLEPAFFHAKLISGKHIFNQEALFACVKGYKLIEPSELESTLLYHESLEPTSISSAESKLQEIINLIKNHQTQKEPK